VEPECLEIMSSAIRDFARLVPAPAPLYAPALAEEPAVTDPDPPTQAALRRLHALARGFPCYTCSGDGLPEIASRFGTSER